MLTVVNIPSETQNSVRYWLGIHSGSRVCGQNLLRWSNTAPNRRLNWSLAFGTFIFFPRTSSCEFEAKPILPGTWCKLGCKKRGLPFTPFFPHKSTGSWYPKLQRPSWAGNWLAVAVLKQLPPNPRYISHRRTTVPSGNLT
jgi:hypothetical protein